MTTPCEVFDYDMVSRARTLRKRQEIPSGHDPADYHSRASWRRRTMAPRCRCRSFTAAILSRDGKAPLLLYGYGSYGQAMPASFATNRLSLVDRGFVYAIAHIRGGADKGWRWYLDGKREKKTNTFDDFAAAGRALIEADYTSAGKIVGHGGSAGGMLMGAVANRAGELFAGIVAEVPFVDVLNTMLDDKLPLTPPEWPEWGNPIADETAFRTILAYSPYENVAAKALSSDPRHGRPDRSARDLLGAREVDRAAARNDDRRRARAAAHQHGRRSRRRIGPLQPARRSRDRLCVCAAVGRSASD